jgi:hypothetical protein
MSARIIFLSLRSCSVSSSSTAYKGSLDQFLQYARTDSRFYTVVEMAQSNTVTDSAITHAARTLLYYVLGGGDIDKFEQGTPCTARDSGAKIAVSRGRWLPVDLGMSPFGYVRNRDVCEQTRCKASRNR